MLMKTMRSTRHRLWQMLHRTKAWPVSMVLLPVNGLDLREYLSDLECSLIQQALDDANGVVARAAEKLVSAARWWRKCVSTILTVKKNLA